MRSAILFGLIACLALSLVLASEESPVQSNDLSAVEESIGQAVESEVRAKRQYYGGFGRRGFGGYGGYGGYGRYGYGGYPFFGPRPFYGGYGGLGGFGGGPYFGSPFGYGGYFG